MKLDQRWIINFDWPLLALVMAICTVGIINLYSAGHSMLASPQEPYYLKQLKWIAVGLLFMCFAFIIDYRTITRHAYILYGISIILLIMVLVSGKTAQGAQRWLSFLGFTFQPSELVKLVLVLVLARYFESRGIDEKRRLRDLAIPFLFMALPFILILKQPDLGTALMLFAIFLFVIFFVGVYWRSLLWGAGVLLLQSPLAWYLLRDYQKERLLTYLDPERDPLGTGYHTIQSMIAIGSGKLTGKGFLAGSQTQLKFLPEQQTDFVFSVLAEEWGFAGALLVVTLLFMLVFKGLKIAAGARDFGGAIIAFGISVFIALGIFVNIGMVVGLLPVVGVPLPFLSYGGSSILVLMICVGLLLNISSRRLMFQA